MTKIIKNNIKWVGYIDWELKKFHGDDYSINNGSSQNAYLIQEEKNILIDTVWTPHSQEFIKNLKQEIDLEKIDCVIINHAESDHSGSLPSLMELLTPNTPIYCTASAQKSIEGQYGIKKWNFKIVKTGDELEIGNSKKIIFLQMPMLHWPDTMACYLTQDNILFSSDAFGQHFAVAELFNDKSNQCLLWKEAVKYFVNIIHPFCPMVLNKINEINNFHWPIDIIAPAHGVIWRNNPMQIVEKYKLWANNYQTNQITIVYDTMWEGTANVAHTIASEIKKQCNECIVKVFNIAKADKNDIMTEVFKSKAIIVGSPTVNNSILSSMASWLEFLKQLRFKNKKAAVFGCYGWSGESIKILQDKLKEAGFNVIDDYIKPLWKLNSNDINKIPSLVKNLLN